MYLLRDLSTTPVSMLHAKISMHREQIATSFRGKYGVRIDAVRGSVLFLVVTF